MRAYYDDSYVRSFSARVVEQLTLNDHPAVVLDKTYFYPTGGGQPNDLGQIGTSAVLDVQSRKSDNAVLHVIEAPVEVSDVSCTLDWIRRFDHMQQHTGQHVLSQAFVQTASASTVGFHLSADSLTIDLDRADLTESEITNVEDLANRIVFDNRPVTARIIDPALADGVRMRRLPEALATNGLRVVEIKDFDLTACGGTHVAHTGEIGLIKVVKTEKRGDKLRIEFCCGGRALRDYRERNRATGLLAVDLTCPVSEMPDAVTRMREDLKMAQRALKMAQEDLTRYEAADLLAQAESREGYRLVSAAFADRDMTALRALASRLIDQPGIVAFLVAYGVHLQLVFGRSSDLAFDMNAVFKNVTKDLPGIKGGGPVHLVQGGGGTADAETALRLLDAARTQLR